MRVSGQTKHGDLVEHHIMTQAESADQPARGPDGQLLDASKITWYNDPDDAHPIQSTSRVQKVGQRSRPIRAAAGIQLAEAIAAEKLQLAHDILCIPGSAVAVEGIFSGGWDTISLQRTRLQPDTIRTLMLVKKHVNLVRAKAA